MKIHISVDMEGVAGVADAADTTPGAPHFDYCRELMTAECNAAIEGCFEGGADEVIVNDSHDGMLNLIQRQLDRRARVIRGSAKALGMMQGIDDNTAATMFIGYHAHTGNDDGVLNHTMRGRDVQGVFLNDEPAGELRLNAALAGWHNIPVALITGDNVLCDEGRKILGQVPAVEVKEAVDKYTALSLHPEVAQERIRDAAQHAVENISDIAPYRLETPAALRVVWNSTSVAAICANVPGVQRVSPREIEYTSADYPELYRLLRVLLVLAGGYHSQYTYD